MAVFIGATGRASKNRLKFDGRKFYHYEPYFEKEVWVATLYDDGIRPTHGYLYPNAIGKKVKSWAKRNGIKFINK
jgi:hypothetical protein